MFSFIKLYKYLVNYFNLCAFCPAPPRPAEFYPCPAPHIPAFSSLPGIVRLADWLKTEDGEKLSENLR